MTHFNIFLEIHLTLMHAFQAWSKVRPFVIFETLVQRLNMRKKLDFFNSKLLTRGYKKFEVLNCLADISYKRRNIYLEDVPKMTNEIPLVFCTHHFPQRSNAQNKKALIKNWHYISEKLENNNNNKQTKNKQTNKQTKKLGEIFPCPRILALKDALKT